MNIILLHQLERYQVGELLLCRFSNNNDFDTFIGKILKINLRSFRLEVIEPLIKYPQKGQILTLKKQSTIYNHFREVDSFAYSYHTKKNPDTERKILISQQTRMQKQIQKKAKQKAKQEPFRLKQGELLLAQAKRLITKGKGVLYRSSLGILKNAIRMAEEQGKYDDLFEFVEPLEKRYRTMKMELDQKTARDKQEFDKMISEIVNTYTKEQIRKRITKLTDEWTLLFAKLNHPRNNIATKTQYEVKLNMKMDRNSVERSNLEYALEKYDQYRK